MYRFLGMLVLAGIGTWSAAIGIDTYAAPGEPRYVCQSKYGFGTLNWEADRHGQLTEVRFVPGGATNPTKASSIFHSYFWNCRLPKQGLWHEFSSRQKTWRPDPASSVHECFDWLTKPKTG
jgi:hypothetical protein